MALLGFGVLAGLGCAPPSEREGAPAAVAPERLVVALRAEPLTLNPVIASDRPSLTVIRRMTSDLIRLDRVTQQAVAGLASGWTVSEDGRRFTLELRPGLRFSDGEPFDADDVLFTFQALLDEQVAAPARNLLLVGGEPVRLRKLGSHSVEFEMATPCAAGVGFFESVSILPEHRLAAPYREGRLREVWGLGTPAEEMPGLGPFRLRRYQPGEQLVLERNPYYWKTDGEGHKLPYFDELIFVFTPNEDAQVIRFRSGEIHLIDNLSAESFNLLDREPGGGFKMSDLGPGLEFSFLFFNLNEVEADRLPDAAARQAWFRRRDFRRAVSSAIDRQAIIRLVYHGRATLIASHVSPGNRRWVNSELVPPERSLSRSRELLSGAGFTWDDAGALHDPQGKEVTFTIVTNSSNSRRLQMATLIQEDLRELGIKTQVAGLEFGALVHRLTSTFDYDACILSLTGNLDPDHFSNVWRSDGNNHLWRLKRSGEEPPWQREIDALMERQSTLLDYGARKEVYDRIQRILAEEEPVILLVSPNVLVGASRELSHFAPAIIEHPTLWNVEDLHGAGRPSPERP